MQYLKANSQNSYIQNSTIRIENMHERIETRSDMAKRTLFTSNEVGLSQFLEIY
jgi:hypothetical protein